MININNKGASGEREVARLLVAAMAGVEARVNAVRTPLSEHVKRCSSSQADRGGTDIVGIPGFAIEVKRGETLLLDKWWQQCVREAKKGDMPVLFYRQNRKAWRVRWYMCTCAPHHWLVCDMHIQQWVVWFTDWYELYLTNQI
jgi:hypothetical protein